MLGAGGGHVQKAQFVVQNESTVFHLEEEIVCDLHTFPLKTFRPVNGRDHVVRFSVCCDSLGERAQIVGPEFIHDSYDR